ncbi:MAG: hypothetical protein GFH27_549283n148 [Chloroflexi bacterium AL-W]|nr:hypothetical protein [Chloroflexi bacterium AL-N1]NOK64731.1 hypothetical protein [Chloroflexi bacterium AL-N10]NOK75972.1 hypothetical protein [Chloroflexi bacterium AL-N5]NOK80269.1 hypothetical protein [Chloroflexi bacterium AL-W]NOK86782.1 hypothetical protein [Chloroflexi bacterium AL-N15]
MVELTKDGSSGMIGAVFCGEGTVAGNSQTKDYYHRSYTTLL